MRDLKIALMLLALGVGALATAMTDGLWDVGPAYVGLVMAVGGFISVFGIQPYPITDTIATKLRAASVLISGFVAIHAQTIANVPKGNAHPWVFAAIGFVGIILGIIGKSPIAHVPPTAADGPLIQPKPPTA